MNKFNKTFKNQYEFEKCRLKSGGILSRSQCARSKDTLLPLGYLGKYIPVYALSLSGVPDYFGRNKISSGGDLSHYSSASLY